MKRAAISVFALLFLVLGLAAPPSQAQLASSWLFGAPYPYIPGPEDFPNSWGWDWGQPIGSKYGPGPYGGFGYFNPYGVYEYSFHNPVKVTGTMYGWDNSWY